MTKKTMNLTHRQIKAVFYQVVKNESSPHWSPAEIKAYGFGYMASWLAIIARRHPAVLEELMNDPRFILAQEKTHMYHNLNAAEHAGTIDSENAFQDYK